MSDNLMEKIHTQIDVLVEEAACDINISDSSQM